MKTNRNKYSLTGVFILLILLPLQVLSQQVDESGANFTSIKLIAQPSSDSVVLRWAPTTPGGWEIANTIGYRVERFKYYEGSEITSAAYESIVQHAIRPLPLDEWMKYAGPDNKFSAIAAQTIYGKSAVPVPLNSPGLISLRNAADELANRYSFALFSADNDPITANALGLRFVDENVVANARYIYRVYVVAPSKEMAFDTAYVMVETLPTQGINPPVGFNYQSGDGSIQLIWPNDLNSGFTGYYLYRSDDGGKTFTQKNQMPIIFVQGTGQSFTNNILFIDSAMVNYKTYIYRLVGVTPFGELSSPAEINAFSRDLTPPPAPILLKPEQVDTGKIKLQWEYTVQPNDLKGFVVSQSYSADNDYSFITPDLLPKNISEYIVDLGDDFEAYYQVASVDTAGNLGYSLPILAVLTETPVPQPPKDIKGNIDKSGRVTLAWNPATSKNIIGYRVYRANNLTHEFIAITGQIHPDTVFIDSVTLNTLTSSVYYRVATVNSRYQYSELSQILKLKRPDNISPAPSVFRDVTVTDKSVTISWHCSPSSDVAIQRILRKTEPNSQWTILDSLKSGIDNYVDFNVTPKVTYYYTLASVDSSGNVSQMAHAVSAKPYDLGTLEPVKNLSLQRLNDNKAVTLSWQVDMPLDSDSWFMIYKESGDGNYVELKALKPEIREFTDSNPGTGNIRYAVVIMNRNGKQSEMVAQGIMIME